MFVVRPGAPERCLTWVASGINYCAGKACQRQTLYLIPNYDHKKVLQHWALGTFFFLNVSRIHRNVNNSTNSKALKINTSPKIVLKLLNIRLTKL
jgi:hypothetical protein